MEERRIKLQVDTNAGQVVQQTNALGVSINQVEDANVANNRAVEQGAQVQQSFRAQMREANMELQRQIQLTGESSQETIAAARAVADLRDQMEMASALADTFNPDQQMRSLGAATQIAGTGLQGVTAGMALFGDQSADTQEQLLKVQAAMAFSDAISNLSNLGDQWQLLKTAIVSNSLIIKANTAATGLAVMVQNAFTGSVTTTTTGFKALKFAIAATGIGLLVVGLALVVTNFEKIKGAIFKAVPALAKVADFIGDIVQGITDFVGVTSEADRAIDRIKRNADQSLALNKKFLAEHGSQLDEFTKQKIEAKNKYNEAVKEDGADQIALAKELNRELAKIEYSRGDEFRKIQKENAEKAKEDAEEIRKKAKEDAEQKAKEDSEIEKQKLADFNKFQIETYKAEVENKRDQEDQQIERLNEITDVVDGIEEEFFNKKKARIDLELELENQKENSKKEITEKGIGFLNLIAGKNKAIQKAAIIAEGIVGIARSVRNTVEGNAGALAKSILTLGPIAGPPAAAPAITLNTAAGGLSVATTAVQTAKALQALGGGSAPSAGSVGGGSRGSVAPPTVAFNNTSENQIGQSLAKSQSEQAPIQVVVAESDITNAQNNVKVLVDKNKF